MEQETRLTLEELTSRPIVGNAHDDYELLNDLAHFYLDARNSIPDRAAAIRHIDQQVMGLGVPDGMTDEDLVKQAVGEAKFLYGEDFSRYYPHCDLTEDEVENLASEARFNEALTQARLFAAEGPRVAAIAVDEKRQYWALPGFADSDAGLPAGFKQMWLVTPDGSVFVRMD